MEPSTVISDATSRNAVSDAMMLSQRPHQPPQNSLTPGFPDLCCSLPEPLNEHHNQFTSDPITKFCCFHFYPYSHAKDQPSAYTKLYTKCSTCATMKVELCLHSTKTPDHRDVTEDMTAPGPTDDALDPECPWIMLAIYAFICWTISLVQAP